MATRGTSTRRCVGGMPGSIQGISCVCVKEKIISSTSQSRARSTCNMEEIIYVLRKPVTVLVCLSGPCPGSMPWERIIGHDSVQVEILGAHGGAWA